MTERPTTYVDIILPLPLNSLFPYSIPEPLTEAVKSGVRVIVPFGKQKMMVGLAVRIHDKEPEFNVKDITRVLDTTPIVTEDQLRMWNWIADYYMSPSRFSGSVIYVSVFGLYPSTDFSPAGRAALNTSPMGDM